MKAIPVSPRTQAKNSPIQLTLNKRETRRTTGNMQIINIEPTNYRRWQLLEHGINLDQEQGATQHRTLGHSILLDKCKIEQVNSIYKESAAQKFSAETKLCFRLLS